MFLRSLVMSWTPCSTRSCSASGWERLAPVGEELAEALPDAVPSPGDLPAIPIPEGEAYVAQRGGKLFHGRECGWIRRIGEPDRVYFKRIAEAREAGFSPCPSCEPWEPAG